LGEGFRHALASAAGTDVPRLVIDTSWQKEDPRIQDSAATIGKVHFWAAAEYDT